MKKIIFVFVTAVFIGSLCFAAQKPEAPLTKTASKAVKVKTFTGKVESITFSNPAKKIKANIIIVDEKGQKLTLIIKPNADIFDKDGNATSLSKIANGAKVTVEYTIDLRTSTNKLKSIRVIE